MSAVEEFYNKVHSKADGRFAESGTGGGHYGGRAEGKKQTAAQKHQPGGPVKSGKAAPKASAPSSKFRAQRDGEGYDPKVHGPLNAHDSKLASHAAKVKAAPAESKYRPQRDGEGYNPKIHGPLNAHDRNLASHAEKAKTAKGTDAPAPKRAVKATTTHAQEVASEMRRSKTVASKMAANRSFQHEQSMKNESKLANDARAKVNRSPVADNKVKVKGSGTSKALSFLGKLAKGVAADNRTGTEQRQYDQRHGNPIKKESFMDGLRTGYQKRHRT